MPAAAPSLSALPQCAGAVLMVRPAAFGFNPETAASNAFQRDPDGEPPAAIAARARAEFDGVVQALRGEGIGVCVVEDTADPPKPDAVFPNNWVSFHADGTLVTYPLASASRRAERRAEVIEAVSGQLGFRTRRHLDLTAHEREGRFLEGTGSLVLDHRQRRAFACPSPRTDAGLVRSWAEALGYEPVLFAASDAQGRPYYHTNVCLWIGTQVAAVALESVAPADRARLLESLTAPDRAVLELTRREIAGFAGNMLELATWDEALGDARVLVLSQSARQALAPATYRRLAGAADNLLAVPVPTLERYGGGSVRCMLAEVFR
ncbi:MAG: amidinotransferase [Gammaproteobacteria bacterium]|nr:amidinotransferase [Gammaproteobacteria bacterium]